LIFLRSDNLKLEFPIKHIDGNLVFGHDKTVWAYYRIHGFSYDFLDETEKLHPYANQKNFFVDIGSDLHFLVVPNPTDVGSILDETISEMDEDDYDLKDQGIHYMSQVKDALITNTLANETSEYMHYIGVQLNKETHVNTTSNKGLSVIQRTKEFLKGLNTPIYHAVGLKPDDILIDEIERYKIQSNRIASNTLRVVSSNVYEIKTPEMTNVVEKNYSTHNYNVDIPYIYDFISGEEATGKGEEDLIYHASRANQKDF